MDTLPWLVYGLIAVILLALVLLVLMPRLLRPGTGRGDFVAEVWLEWSLGRGSTMYRQRFSTQKQAYIYVRIYAWALDYMLPTHFTSTGRDGRRVLVNHDMAIQYGVRQATEAERRNFRTIWSPSMPGTPTFAGEHADFHPLTVANRQASETELKLQL